LQHRREIYKVFNDAQSAVDLVAAGADAAGKWKAPAATLSRGHVDPRRSVIVSSPVEKGTKT
jgi:hypothetical protein